MQHGYDGAEGASSAEGPQAAVSCGTPNEREELGQGEQTRNGSGATGCYAPICDSNFDRISGRLVGFESADL